MKLAEALILRADLQNRFKQTQHRLQANALIQEGTSPAEDPLTLLSELEQIATDLTTIIQQINRTNSVTEFETGSTLSDVLASREILRWRQSAYRNLVEAATIRFTRQTRSEILFESVIDIAETRRQTDELAREYRELDTKIQEANWLTELIE